MFLSEPVFFIFFSAIISSLSNITVKNIRETYHWCPINNISNYGSYTWNKNPTDDDVTLEGWPPGKSRDPKNYINLENFIIMDFRTCEKGSFFIIFILFILSYHSITSCNNIIFVMFLIAKYAHKLFECSFMTSVVVGLSPVVVTTCLYY